MSFSLDNKTVMVTGGTGSIGSQVVKELLQEGANVIVYSRDQNKQFKMNYSFASKRVTFKNGDICDQSLLMRAMKNVDVVIHCAASKHVGLCEQNADSAIKVNVEGTRNCLQVSLQRGVNRFILLSTDKAVNPTSVMGSTKFLAERLTMEFAKSFPCSIVRLGNVFGSNGSVVEIFKDRIANKLPIIVNDSEAMRFCLTIKEAGQFIVDRVKEMNGEEIFIKRMKYLKIGQLAECMAPVGYAIASGTLSHAEKKIEALCTDGERYFSHPHDKDFFEINSTRREDSFDPIFYQFTNDEINQMLKGL